MPRSRSSRHSLTCTLYLGILRGWTSLQIGVTFMAVMRVEVRVMTVEGAQA
jgi:hypothetical protein